MLPPHSTYTFDTGSGEVRDKRGMDVGDGGREGVERWRRG